MAAFKARILLIFAILLCASCSIKHADVQVISLNEGELALSGGIKSYEDGDYKEAARLLKDALSKGLPAKSDQVKAHKYLAFVNCVTGQRKKCASEFKNALKIDPNFDLHPAEAGHPIWGPTFRSVKARMAQGEY